MLSDSPTWASSPILAELVTAARHDPLVRDPLPTEAEATCRAALWLVNDAHATLADVVKWYVGSPPDWLGSSWAEEDSRRRVLAAYLEATEPSRPSHAGSDSMRWQEIQRFTFPADVTTDEEGWDLPADLAQRLEQPAVRRQIKASVLFKFHDIEEQAEALLQPAAVFVDDANAGDPLTLAAVRSQRVRHFLLAAGIHPAVPLAVFLAGPDTWRVRQMLPAPLWPVIPPRWDPAVREQRWNFRQESGLPIMPNLQPSAGEVLTGRVIHSNAVYLDGPPPDGKPGRVAVEVRGAHRFAQLEIGVRQVLAAIEQGQPDKAA